eukprot:TRINITY_DN2429_c0_g1_i1.p1 TRINITY_DN2429_c0_g1~~TRINITY_DN2429_c0_g1_i1.p1  ORF type:complete len:457 (-),score=95.08 TRINITY_DN2429_c0_g1_i1:100-1395(-)
MAFVQARFSKFFVFNPRLYGLREENDHEKIMYYFGDTEIAEQMMQVGFCEALNHIPKTFTESPTQSCSTSKHRYTLLNPELGWWMVMVTEYPKIVNIKSNPDKTQKPIESIEYLSTGLDDLPMDAIITQIYKEFVLFNGNFEYVREQYSEKKMREIFTNAFPPLIENLKHELYNINTSLEGVSFLPVDKNVYLRIQSFVNYCENSFESICYSAFFFQKYLVWSGMDQSTMRSLYHWLFTHFDFNGKGYLLGPENVNADDSLITYNSPLIHLNNGKVYNLVIFQLLSCTTLFIVETRVAQKLAFYQSLSRLITNHVDFLARILGEHARKISTSKEFQFLYFNNMNLALKSSLPFETLPQALVEVLNRIHADFERDLVDEVLVGTYANGWVVGRKSDQREYYIVFDQQSSNLLEINDEVKKLSSAYFRDIFID